MIWNILELGINLGPLTSDRIYSIWRQCLGLGNRGWVVSVSAITIHGDERGFITNGGFKQGVYRTLKTVKGSGILELPQPWSRWILNLRITRVNDIFSSDMVKTEISLSRCIKGHWISKFSSTMVKMNDIKTCRSRCI